MPPIIFSARTDGRAVHGRNLASGQCEASDCPDSMKGMWKPFEGGQTAGLPAWDSKGATHLDEISRSGKAYCDCLRQRYGATPPGRRALLFNSTATFRFGQRLFIEPPRPPARTTPAPWRQVSTQLRRDWTPGGRTGSRPGGAAPGNLRAFEKLCECLRKHYPPRWKALCQEGPDPVLLKGPSKAIGTGLSPPQPPNRHASRRCSGRAGRDAGRGRESAPGTGKGRIGEGARARLRLLPFSRRLLHLSTPVEPTATAARADAGFLVGGAGSRRTRRSQLPLTRRRRPAAEAHNNWCRNQRPDVADAVRIFGVVYVVTIEPLPGPLSCTAPRRMVRAAARDGCGSRTRT